MISSENAPTITTPDGQTGITLQWPSGGGKHFKILRGNGADAEHVSVVPVLLPDGEVRFYGPKHDGDEIRRSGSLA